MTDPQLGVPEPASSDYVQAPEVEVPPEAVELAKAQRTADIVAPADTCATCGQTDDHPKFHLLQSTSTGLRTETHHHDCAASLGHEKAAIMLRHIGDLKGDRLRMELVNPDHPVHHEIKQHTLREAATIHVLNKRILEEPTPSVDEILEYFVNAYPEDEPHQSFVDHVYNLVGGQKSSTKHGRGNNFLNAELGSGSYVARTGAVMLELDATMGSQAANSTAVTGGSYANQTCAFGSATSQTGVNSSSIANSGTPTYTGMPATTVNSIELLDSNGTPVHLQYGPLTAPKTTGSGDTVSVAVGAVVVNM